MTVTILSPHPDDAVLSCWHLLAGTEDVQVVNVFAGVPRPTSSPGWWDALTGAPDPASRMSERLEEDRRALGLAGRSATNLGFFDAQYRQRAPARSALARAIARQTSETVYAPAALAGHPDHVLVRNHALALRALGVDVHLYADMPHAIAFGWPAWISGTAAARYLRPERLWEWSLSGAGLDPLSLRPEILALDGMLGDKDAAIAEYRTQAAALAILMPSNDLGYEVAWAVPGGNA